MRTSFAIGVAVKSAPPIRSAATGERNLQLRLLGHFDGQISIIAGRFQQRFLATSHFVDEDVTSKPRR
jgi:hypothetical protein